MVDDTGIEIQFSALSPWSPGGRAFAATAKATMLRSRTTPALRGALRRLSTFDDVTPMTIADRVEQAAVRKGVFAGLPGRGKPLGRGPRLTGACGAAVEEH